MAPWIIDPKSSYFYNFQCVVISVALQIELICVPLVLLDASILRSYESNILVLNIIWIINIAVKLQTIKLERPSDNPVHIAGIYLISDFLFDVGATLPSMLMPLNNKVFVLRILHINELSKVGYPLQKLVEFAFPNSRIGRLNLSLIIKFLYFILIGAHYLICLWIWIGTKQLMHDTNVPWLIKNPSLGSGSNLYIFVFYWIFTIFTTVGYGDFTGGTTGEYLVTIAIEFAAIICFTVLTLLVNQLV
jgi:hypothetical protein